MKIKLEAQRLRQPQLSRLLQRLLAESGPDGESKRTNALVSAVLEDAVRENVSDVHLDPVNGGYQIRFRIDGRLVDTILLEPDLGRSILRSFKTHADIEPGYALKPEDGRCEFHIGDRVIAARVASIPSVLGEKLAVRFLPADLEHLRLDGLGLSENDYAQFKRAMNDAHGMILVSGPTGAGKTTTVYALLHELKATNRAIVTIEDPVEYVIEGITQIQVNERQGLTFANGVRGMLRLDPDIIAMGEIRDVSATRAALEAADSGHVFLSTLHARDAAGTVTALRNFGLADHEIAATLDLVVAQRLVRRLCPACRRQEPPTEAEIQWLKFFRQAVPERTWRAVGCSECSMSGYRGRIGIFEVWRLNEEFAQMILEHADERKLRRAIRSFGILSLLEDDLKKVEAGLSTFAEMQNVGGLEFFLANPTKKRTRSKAAVASEAVLANV